MTYARSPQCSKSREAIILNHKKALFSEALILNHKKALTIVIKLTDAGKVFDTNLIDSELVSSAESFPLNDVGIRHGAVAEEVLLNGLSSGYN